MNKIYEFDIAKDIESHQKWINHESAGERIEFRDLKFVLKANSDIFRAENLFKMNFINCDLGYVSFKGSNLSGCDFINCKMNDVDLSYTQLDKSVFRDNYLKFSTFNQALVNPNLGFTFKNNQIQFAIGNRWNIQTLHINNHHINIIGDTITYDKHQMDIGEFRDRKDICNKTRDILLDIYDKTR